MPVAIAMGIVGVVGDGWLNGWMGAACILGRNASHGAALGLSLHLRHMPFARRNI